MKIEKLGPYKILDPLGRGGMGTVYRALDTSTNRPAAVKVLSPVVAHDSGFRERFEAEVQSLKKLQHPNIVELFGYGEQDGLLFYAMELVDGRSLQEEISDGRRFNWREALPIVVDVCRALKHAHDHGVIHRDIKPANLLITDDINHSDSNHSDSTGADAEDSDTTSFNQVAVKLADFGIAKLFGNTSLTVDGGVLGTADYMAPEKAEGEPVTPRSDLYSLGSVFYAMLSGQPPFRGKSMPEVIHKVRFDVPKPIGRLVDDVPKELEHILNQLLAKSPSERVPTALALSKRLQSLQHGMTMKIDKAMTNREDEPGDEPSEPAEDLFGQDTIAAGSMAAQSVVATQDNATEQDLPKAKDHFVTVEEERRSAKDSSEDSESIAWRIFTILALTIPLLLMFWGGYRMLAPPTADDIFQRVKETADREEQLYESQAIEKGPHPELSVHRAEVSSFLKRFPDDPRAEQMKQWNKLILADTMGDRFERKMRLGWEPTQVSPVEDLVLSAMQSELTDPPRALIQYNRILALFPDSVQHESDVELIVQSVEGRITKLKREMRKTADLHVALIHNRLTKAKELAEKNPEDAKAILVSIINIYRDEDWAEKPVALAEMMLQAFPK